MYKLTAADKKAIKDDATAFIDSFIEKVNGDVVATKSKHDSAIATASEKSAQALKAEQDAHKATKDKIVIDQKAVDDLHKGEIQDKDDEIGKITLELDDIKSATKKILKEVPGTFKSTNGKTYRFKKGALKTRLANQQNLVDSEELIKDKAHHPYLEKLIEVGYGLLEEV